MADPVFPLASRIDAGSPHAAPSPCRRWRLVLDLGADSITDLHRALESVQFAIQERSSASDDGEVVARPFTVTSGGYDSGFHVELIEHPGMDHDQYVEANARWLAEHVHPGGGSS